jgi:hypothetical protein
MWSRRLAEAQVISVRFGVPPPVMLAVAEWLRRRAVTPATRVRFSPVNPIFGVMLLGGRLVASRQSLKLTSGVRFAPSQPQPGRSAAGRCSLTADVDGSSPSPAAILKCFRRVSFKGKDRTLRTFGLPFESAYPYQSGLRPSGEDAALRTLKFRFESGGLDQVCGAGWYPGWYPARRLAIGAERI